MKWVFEVDGADFSDVIAISGMEWMSMMLDTDDSGRSDTSLSMERPEVNEVRQIKWTGREKVPYERIHALALAVRKKFFNITYLDVVDGVTTKTFFHADLTARTQFAENGRLYYNGISLTTTWRDVEPVLE